MSSYSQPYGLTAIHPRPIEVGVFSPGEDKKPIVLMEIFIDNYVQMRYNLFTLYKKYCIFCFMVISHKESAADVLSDFSSDCLRIPQEY